MKEYTRAKIAADAEYAVIEAGVDGVLEKHPAVAAALNRASREVVYGYGAGLGWYRDLIGEYDQLSEDQQRAVDTATAAIDYELGE